MFLSQLLHCQIQRLFLTTLGRTKKKRLQIPWWWARKRKKASPGGGSLLPRNMIGPEPSNRFWTPTNLGWEDRERISSSVRRLKTLSSESDGVILSILSRTFGLGNDFAIHQEQEDLSSKCVEEAGEFIDELADQIKLDFSTFARHSYEDDNGSIDSDLWSKCVKLK
jgi:hypothetical protein